MKRLLVIVGMCVVGGASAQLTFVGSFTGPFSEGFDSFPNYLDDPNFLMADPTTTFGGAAQLHGANNVVYQPGYADFGLNGNGPATIRDGIRGMGINSNVDSATFTFSSGNIVRFGGYFAHSDASQNSVSIRFLDATGGQVGGTQTTTIQGNTMLWLGWSSTQAFTSVEISGSYVVMDGLQARPVPEPASLTAVGLGAAALLRRRKSKQA